jgi:hypothetical protein
LETDDSLASISALALIELNDANQSTNCITRQRNNRIIFVRLTTNITTMKQDIRDAIDFLISRPSSPIALLFLILEDTHPLYIQSHEEPRANNQSGCFVQPYRDGMNEQRVTIGSQRGSIKGPNALGGPQRNRPAFNN